MKLALRFGAAILVSLLAAPTAAQPSRCASYGFHRIEDEGRSLAGAARPIHFGLWLPSGCRGRWVTRRDLARDSHVQTGETEAAITGVEQTGPALSAALDRPTGAVRAPARLQPRRRPLVVYIHPTVVQAAPIAEALAREGFAVASFAWRGSFGQAFDVGISGLISEMLDAQAIIRELVRRGIARERPIFVIGMSFGALTALCLAQADPRVTALVSHDGGITTPTGVRLSPLCPYFAAERPRAQALFLYDASYAGTTWAVADPLTRLRRRALAIPVLEHRDYVGTVLLRAEADPVMTDREARVRNFRAMSAATVAFLLCVRDRRPEGCDISLP